jgi:hypothetical protein
MPIRISGETMAATTDLNRSLAHHLLALAAGCQDELKREWYVALVNNVRNWVVPRDSRPSTTPFQDCFAFVAETGAIYCEGLVITGANPAPQTAIFASLPDGLVCFTHDLSEPHGLQLIPFADTVVNTLYLGHGIEGPYLLNPDARVLGIAIPLMQRVLRSRRD